MSFFVDFTVFDRAVPDGSTSTTTGGHLLYASAGNAADSSCFSTPVQNRTPDNRYEAVTISASYLDSASAPRDLCTQTSTLAARFLDTAGLR